MFKKKKRNRNIVNTDRSSPFGNFTSPTKQQSRKILQISIKLPTIFVLNKKREKSVSGYGTNSTRFELKKKVLS
jgi:hypothetical protein